MQFIILMISLLCYCSLFADNTQLDSLFSESVQTEDMAKRKSIRENILKAEPDSAYGIFCKAWIMSINNYTNKEEIIDVYKKATKLKPDLWVAYLNIAEEYMELKEYSSAIKMCDKALNYSDYWAIYLNRGRAYGSDGAHKKALDDFDKVISMKPDEPSAYFFKGITYNYMKEYGMEQYYISKAKDMGFIPAIEASKKRTVIVVPFSDDHYGVTEKIISSLIKDGYRIVERNELSRVFDEMKLEMSGATEYEYVKSGKILNAGYIIVGSAYEVQKEYIPPPPQNYRQPQSPAEAFGRARIVSRDNARNSRK